MKTTQLSVREIDYLFNPYNHRKLSLLSRIVMAPVSRMSVRNGVPEQEASQYYLHRALHYVGLIITEPVAVNDPAASTDSGMSRFYGGQALRAWKSICRLVHQSACRIAPLLDHVGMLRAPADDNLQPECRPVGPSGIEPESFKLSGESLSVQRMRQILGAFADAAASARILGFDAVSINGGSAGLLEQFLRPQTNHRHDEFGGDMMARTRFVSQVVQAVRKAVGRNMPIIFRFSQYSKEFGDSALVTSPAELEQMLQPLCDSGVDFFICAGQRAHLPAFSGNPLSLSGWTRLLSGRPVIAEGGIGLPGFDMLSLVRKLRSAEIDLVALGRSLLADAEWASKIRHAEESDIISSSERVGTHLSS